MTAKTYDRQTAKFLAVIGENMPELSGDMMQGWIEDPKAVQKVLKDVFCTPKETPRFNIWKTIKLGTGLKTAKDFHKALMSNGFKTSEWANEILGKLYLTAASKETEVDLIVVTVAELGFKRDALRDQIYKRAKELGLELCPPEVGPQLRLQYPDQPNGERVLIGMEPITDFDGYPGVFVVRCGDLGPWLDNGWSRPNFVWFHSDQWAFVRPRK